MLPPRPAIVLLLSLSLSNVPSYQGYFRATSRHCCWRISNLLNAAGELRGKDFLEALAGHRQQRQRLSDNLFIN